MYINGKKFVREISTGGLKYARPVGRKEAASKVDAYPRNLRRETRVLGLVRKYSTMYLNRGGLREVQAFSSATSHDEARSLGPAIPSFMVSRPFLDRQTPVYYRKCYFTEGALPPKEIKIQGDSNVKKLTCTQPSASIYYISIKAGLELALEFLELMVGYGVL